MRRRRVSRGLISPVLTLFVVMLSACVARPIPDRLAAGPPAHDVSVGMSMREVRAVLGRPDERRRDGDLETWLYETSGGFDGPRCRRLRFGSDGRLAAPPLYLAAPLGGLAKDHAPLPVREKAGLEALPEPPPPLVAEGPSRAVGAGEGSEGVADRGEIEQPRTARETPTWGTDWLDKLPPRLERRPTRPEPGRTRETLDSQLQAVRPRLLSSTFVVWSVNEVGNVTSLGSAVAIMGDVLLTNEHVIRGAFGLHVRRVKSAGRTYRVSGTIVDSDRDLALLSVPGLVALPLQLSERAPRMHELVYVAGNPDGREGAFDVGLVTGFPHSVRGTLLIEMTAPISHGSSGGPVVDVVGQLVGLSVGGLQNGRNVAVHHTEIVDLLREHPMWDVSDMERLQDGWDTLAVLAHLGKRLQRSLGEQQTPNNAHPNWAIESQRLMSIEMRREDDFDAVLAKHDWDGLASWFDTEVWQAYIALNTTPKGPPIFTANLSFEEQLGAAQQRQPLQMDPLLVADKRQVLAQIDATLKAIGSNMSVFTHPRTAAIAGWLNREYGLATPAYIQSEHRLEDVSIDQPLVAFEDTAQSAPWIMAKSVAAALVLIGSGFASRERRRRCGRRVPRDKDRIGEPDGIRRNRTSHETPRQ